MRRAPRVGLFSLLVAAAAGGQILAVRPEVVRQGEVVRVRSSDAAAARLNGRTVRLFPQADGSRLGLMPVPANQQPGTYPLELLGTDGAVLHNGSITVRDAHFLRQNVVLGPAQAELKPSPGEMETVRALRNTVSETRYWAEPLVDPVPGCMSSRFGVARWFNGKPAGYYHSGVDQRARFGQPVRAVAGGTVRIARLLNLHGGTVGIDHGQGLVSFYLHLSKFAVAEGVAVRKGQIVGYAGATGRATGPHLHWALAVNGVEVNPRQWVRLQPCTGKKR